MVKTLKNPIGTSTRELILEHGTELFGRLGYDRVSVRQIAEVTGTNQGAITYHFGGKEGLYREILKVLAVDIDTFLGPLLDQLNNSVSAFSGDTEKLKSAALSFIENWARQTLSNDDVQRRMPVLARELIAPSANFDTIYKGFYLRLNEVFENLLHATLNPQPDALGLTIRAHALTHLMLSFISNEQVLWKQLDWDGYSAKRVEALLPSLRSAFLDAAGLSD